MSRNFKEYEGDIFHKVFGRAPTQSVRFKTFESDDDQDLKNFFNKLKFEKKIHLLRRQIAAIYSFDENIYIFFIGEDKSSFIFEDQNGFFEERGVSVSFFIRAVKDCGLELRLDIDEDVLDSSLRIEHEDVEAYEGHDWKDVYDVFPYITPVLIPKESVLSGLDFESQLYFVYSFISNQTHLNISTLLPKYRELIQQEYPTFPAENFFYCFTSVHWKHLFLETYRCLESMFSYAAPLNLKKTLNVDIGLKQLYLACKDELKWQRKEDSSIELLFQNIGVQDIKSTGFDLVEDSPDPLKYTSKVAEHVYKVRNSLVHQSDRVTDNFNFDENQWVILIELVLLVTLKNSQILTIDDN